MLNRSSSKQNSHRTSRGQSMVEFALIAPLAIVMLLVGVQYAIIGSAALAVSQAASTLARYAAVNKNAMPTNGTATLSNTSPPGSLLSTTICPASDTTCSKLTVTVNSYSGSSNTQTNSPRHTDRLLITLTYDATNKIALPNPFMQIPGIFPGITFPTSLTYSDSQMYETD
jgi:Flp pilus assembly protein TadG